MKSVPPYRHKPTAPAAALRSRRSQLLTKSPPPEEQRDEFHDSELPPPPQLRRARATADPAHRVRDKNTGIKNRDASGAKQAPHPRHNKGRQSHTSKG